MESATALFERKGFSATSVDAIVNSAGVTKGAFYHYFGSKKSILAEIQASHVEERLASSERILAEFDRPVDRLRALIRDMVGTLANRRAQAATFYQERREMVGPEFAAVAEGRRKIDRIVRMVIQQGIDEGAFDPGLDARVVSLAITGMGAWSLTWFRPTGPFTVDELSESFTKLVLNGVNISRKPEVWEHSRRVQPNH